MPNGTVAYHVQMIVTLSQSFEAPQAPQAQEGGGGSTTVTAAQRAPYAPLAGVLNSWTELQPDRMAACITASKRNMSQGCHTCTFIVPAPVTFNGVYPITLLPLSTPRTGLPPARPPVPPSSPLSPHDDASHLAPPRLWAPDPAALTNLGYARLPCLPSRISPRS